jgi:ABC-2 type transport system ATP-binding protein
VQIAFREPADVPEGLALVRRAVPGAPATAADRQVTVAVEDGARSLVRVAGALDEAGIPVEDLALRRPTLDEVILQLTGEPA